MAQIVLLPVRHHSPACAFHVAGTIERLGPSVILVEGPDNAAIPLSDWSSDVCSSDLGFRRRRSIIDAIILFWTIPRSWPRCGRGMVWEFPRLSWICPTATFWRRPVRGRGFE